ncbi:TetR/AcrR family transcriptional regulator [Sphaerisporangium flaviroseum]|uniref:TetR/AcrR family transcriptional regulator n=1 Tax=Sphaerisporangium flaviroseum TaxID=509199 RepID=A0ABP7IIY8_9ACTN
MPPPPNVRRRQALADAAIEVLGRSGIHGLSHRAVDERAGLPAGTASNYFRSRDALLRAAAERVVELHQADMREANGLAGAPIDTGGLIELIAGSLHYSATAHRARYLAIYELNLEATRRPELRRALDTVARTTLDFTVRQHRDLGLATTREEVQTLVTLFGGALLNLAAGPPEEVTPELTRTLARAMVTGAMGRTAGDGCPPAGESEPGPESGLS